MGAWWKKATSGAVRGTSTTTCPQTEIIITEFHRPALTHYPDTPFKAASNGNFRAGCSGVVSCFHMAQAARECP